MLGLIASSKYGNRRMFILLYQYHQGLTHQSARTNLETVFLFGRFVFVSVHLMKGEHGARQMKGPVKLRTMLSRNAPYQVVN